MTPNAIIAQTESLLLGLNFVVQLADLVVSSQPYLLMHGVYFLLYAVAYLVFSIVHYVSGIGSGDGRKYIYKSLDWGSPGSSSVVAAIVLIIISPLVNLLFWYIVQRVRYARRATQARSGSWFEGSQDGNNSAHIELSETQECPSKVP